MKKLLFVAVAVLCCNMAIAKQIDVQTAKKVANNFLTDAAGTPISNTELVYTAHSNASADNYYYVFNAGNQGFVIVTADDRVKPIIGYSTENSFDANNIPTNAAGLLGYCQAQIAYVIEHNIPATGEIAARWHSLVTNGQISWKTTATTVSPLLTTRWNQNPYYNALCPVNSSGVETVAGCVATATAQVMKFWNYPSKGTGSHSYNTAYGILSADFGATTYDWAAMPNALSSDNASVATLTYHVGVAVEMNYNTAANGGSGAYVIEAQSPKVNCAEYALTNYFGYATTTRGIEKRNYTEQNWIGALKSEIAAMRPVIYAGFGTSGGHCWVADGYDANDFLHINWGWGGASDGYFEVTAMNPPALGAGGGSGGFNYNQYAIIGIQPAAMATPDAYENNNVYTTAHEFTTQLGSGNTNIRSTGSDIHATNDIDYYMLVLPVGDNYVVKARLQDKMSNTDGNTYTLDAKLATSRNPKVVWSQYENTSLTDQVINNGGVVHFRVAPQVVGEMGTYVLDINVSRTTTGINETQNNQLGVAIYPNPANNEISINLDNAKAEISLVDMQGRTVQHITAENQATAKLDVSALTAGMYLVNVKTGDITIARKISVAH